LHRLMVPSQRTRSARRNHLQYQLLLGL
jgi:hypothetical protein